MTKTRLRTLTVLLLKRQVKKKKLLFATYESVGEDGGSVSRGAPIIYCMSFVCH